MAVTRTLFFAKSAAFGVALLMLQFGCGLFPANAFAASQAAGADSLTAQSNMVNYEFGSLPGDVGEGDDYSAEAPIASPAVSGTGTVKVNNVASGIVAYDEATHTLQLTDVVISLGKSSKRQSAVEVAGVEDLVIVFKGSNVISGSNYYGITDEAASPEGKRRIVLSGDGTLKMKGSHYEGFLLLGSELVVDGVKVTMQAPMNGVSIEAEKVVGLTLKSGALSISKAKQDAVSVDDADIAIAGGTLKVSGSTCIGVSCLNLIVSKGKLSSCKNVEDGVRCRKITVSGGKVIASKNKEDCGIHCASAAFSKGSVVCDGNHGRGIYCEKNMTVSGASVRACGNSSYGSPPGMGIKVSKRLVMKSGKIVASKNRIRGLDADVMTVQGGSISGNRNGEGIFASRMVLRGGKLTANLNVNGGMDFTKAAIYKGSLRAKDNYYHGISSGTFIMKGGKAYSHSSKIAAGLRAQGVADFDVHKYSKTGGTIDVGSMRRI